MQHNESFFIPTESNIQPVEPIPNPEEYGYEEEYPPEPLMDFHPNLEGKVCLTLWGWDTQESFEGYTPDEIDQLIEMLTEAKQVIINNEDTKQMRLNFDDV